ncbi:ATP-binding cassette domain-containing protein [Vibrio sp. SM6]|uniref:ATP-binding cassette domain-containing protein n=1 Tax=Vibrio agarilyticus TaxID=2726741 RepID=A0A7X8TMS6_9VIBR|nr:ATP-binding cassette domain-containing protein [Vibrio agarilyticus]NLS11401.1 ATP-binding cassette domain-containing protein [Vibrio agarilyticus]
MSLELKQIALFTRDGAPLIAPFDLSVLPGDVACLMGPSGCGKSTLLDAIAGHLNSDFTFQGEIILNGVTLNHCAPHQRHVGILFQDDLLFPHLSIWENLAFALPNAIKGKARRQQALEALKEVALEELAHSYPDQISGGQRARVALVRMLLAKPQVVLLDEPFSKLDKALRSQFRHWVFTQLAEKQIPTLLVTHDEADVPCGSAVFHWPWQTLTQGAHHA